MLYTTRIYMQNTGKYNTGRLCSSGMNTSCSFWLRFFDMRRETQFLKGFRNHTMLTPPHNARHISWCFRSQFHLRWSGPQKLNRRRNGRKLNTLPKWQRTQLSASMVQCQLSTDSFSKFSETSLPVMTLSTFQPHFLAGGYYDNGDCHILGAACVKLYIMTIHLNSLPE